MKNIFDHIEHIKGKPHHVRKQVAVATAAFGSALVALVWFVGSYASGTFAIQGSNFALSTGQENTVVKVSDTGESQNLAGVGAAAALQGANTSAHIEIVDTNAATSSAAQAEQTTLPF